jgi:uncharacterized protein (TIGR04255 family)
MASPLQHELPDYERPPVVETVLGVQFDRLPRFGNAHLGAFWRWLDASKWPNVSDAPELLPQIEQFGSSAKWRRGLQIQFAPDIATRLQIRNRSGDRMVQVQNGRLHFNWIGRRGEVYPRYESARTEFEYILSKFTEFATIEDCGEFRPNQWEVTYLNQIPKDTVWKSPDDWGFFCLLAGVPDIEQVVRGESFGGEWHFVIPEERGRLHVHWRHARNAASDEQEIVVLTFTARGPVEDASKLLEGIDLGRKTIVQCFASLMSKPANQYWGLKNAAS